MIDEHQGNQGLERKLAMVLKTRSLSRLRSCALALLAIGLSGFAVAAEKADFDSQGATTVDWTGSTGHSSSSTWLFGSCSVGTWVTVDLEVQSPYGTFTRNWDFSCPSGSLP